MKIIIDTREKKPYDFSAYSDIEIESSTLKTGDYSIGGLETLVAVERKASISEIALNLGSGWKRFERELERLKDYKYKILLLEFTLDDLLQFPYNAPIPAYLKKRIRVSGKFLVSKLKKIVDKYDLELIECESRTEAEDAILERLLEIEANEY